MIFFEDEINKFKKFKHYEKLILDPGIGFGKNLKHNLMILTNISLFHSLGFPILIGTSRKKFINQISGKYDTKERIGGTLSSIIFSFSQGNETNVVLDGHYQGKNLYIQNPFSGSGVGFCVIAVYVNDDVTTDQVNSSAFEIDFANRI